MPELKLGPTYDFANSEPSLPRSKIADRPRQLPRGERRPRRGREPQLGVSAFPQQEIAQSLLAARSDQQIDIRRVIGDAAATAQAPLEFHGRPAPARARRNRGAAHRVARGVVDGKSEMKTLATGGHPFRGRDLLDEPPRETIAAANDAEADSRALESRALDDKVAIEQRHQAGDFS